MRSAQEEAYARAIRTREDRAAASEKAKSTEEIGRFLRDSLELLVAGSTYGEFVTPDAERAALFSKGRVVRFEIQFGTLRKALESGGLYVGVEKVGDASAVELGLLPGDTPRGNHALADLLIRTFRGAASETKTLLFN